MIWFLVSLTVCGLTDASELQPVREHSLDLAGLRLELIYQNDFGRPQEIAREERLLRKVDGNNYQRVGRPDAKAEWIAEGWGGVMIHDGKLCVAPSRFGPDRNPEPVAEDQRSHMVVWNRQVFPADFLLEFTVNHRHSTDGLTLVLFAATGRREKDIFAELLPPRRAEYRTYHSGELANYTVSYWSRNGGEQPGSKQWQERFSCRLRKNPGMQLVAAGRSQTDRFADRDYRIRILKFGKRIEVEIDGKVVIQWEEVDEPLGAGRIGLRCMKGVNQVTYDDFSVWSVAKGVSRR
jgi:hypothetical protein